MTTHPAYRIDLPERRLTSVVFATPHSGADYSSEFLSRAELDATEIRSSEDAFVDKLFASAPLCGAAILMARVPRAYVDLNRAPEELDPALIEGVGKGSNNPRVASGLGVIPRVVANGRAIYRGKMSIDEAHGRIEGYWRPYHDALQTLLDENHRSFGEAILVDCHSMPREALTQLGARPAGRPEIVIGDRFGSTAARHLVDEIESIFSEAGLRVARNIPFAGAHILQAYGRPSRGQHAIQIEIDRSIYMDEEAIAPSADFDAFQALMDGVVERIAQMGAPEAGWLAAE